MKKLRLLLFFILLISANHISQTRASDTLQYIVSINYYFDLSDSYGKGDFLNSEISLTKSWYGASIGYGHFNAHSVILYKIIVEDLDKTIDIQLDEVSYVKSVSISQLLIPIKNSFFEVDLLIGIVYGKATSSQFKSVDYNYNLNENRFNYIYKNYVLVKQTHFGYQAGFNISFYPLKNAGIQLNSRIQHLNNGGSFFFVGGGVCFRF